LAALYEVSDQQEINLLVSMAATSRQRDWWHRYDDVMPRQFSIYLGFEGDAASIHTYETLFIPGLLQTPGYAHALAAAAQPEDDEEQASRRVEARVLRQTLLARPQAPRLHAIIDEAALRRVVGSNQVIPYRAGAYMPMEGGFIILRFTDTTDADVVCVDLLTRSLYLDDTTEVARYRDAWENVLATAEPPASSIDSIKAAAEELAP
jgi:hypothetical protein